MTRLEMYRKKRTIKRVILSSMLFFFIFTSAGLTAVDYSINSIINNEQQIRLISINFNDSIKEIIILNYHITIPLL